MSDFRVGVRAIDALLTCGEGQRMGIFAAAGVGKSTLLGMIARSSAADVNVIALVGERGREVRDFLERELGPDGRSRSVIVCATSDKPSLVRWKAAYVATAIAEYFRDHGRRVMFMMDSVTRFARAQREIGLASGEPPARQGYTPSVFAELPRLLERAGNNDRGSVTAFYTILRDSDTSEDPIDEEVRSILDGHIYLSRKLSQAKHYPAIDVLASKSRVQTEILREDPDHLESAAKLNDILSEYQNNLDLIQSGIYRPGGGNPKLDRALELEPAIQAFLRQRHDESAPFEDSVERLKKLFQ